MTWSRTTFFFVDFFCWKNLRVDTNCFSYKLGLGGFFCWKKNSVSRYIHLCIIRLCFAYYAKHKAAELMPSVYFFGKRTEIFFVTLFYEVLIKTDMRNDLVTSSMKVSVFLETHHSSIFLKMNTICLAIIFLTHKLFSNQIKISDKKKKKRVKVKTHELYQDAQTFMCQKSKQKIFRTVKWREDEGSRCENGTSKNSKLNCQIWAHGILISQRRNGIFSIWLIFFKCLKGQILISDYKIRWNSINCWWEFQTFSQKDNWV